MIDRGALGAVQFGGAGFSLRIPAAELVRLSAPKAPARGAFRNNQSGRGSVPAQRVRGQAMSEGRLVYGRGMSEWPRPQPRHEYVTTFTVAQSFAYQGRSLVKGETLAGDDPVALAGNATRPDLLLVRVQRKEF